MQRFRRMVLLISIAIALLTLLVVWMAGGVQGPRTFEARVRRLAAPAGGPQVERDPSTLTVLTWNIAWGYGWGSEGSGNAKPRAHFERNLDTMGRVLATLKPDLILLQEADFDSARSHRMDQAERLARQSGLTYVAPAVSWSANYVPFPYWPPSDHFGRVLSGGAVLSRYPLKNNRVELLSKPTENPWWYNLFYLFRFVQTVEVDHPMGTIQVVNSHLEAFDPANRLNQAYRVREVIDDLDGALVVFGGDLNSVPPEAPKRHAYPDEPNTDHRQDETIKVLRSARSIDDTVPSETLTSTPSAWFTFPAHTPNRKLDYIFAADKFEVVSTRVVTEAGDASDHLPVLTVLRFK